MLDRGHWRVRTGLYSLCSNEFTEFRQVRYRVFTWFSFPLDQPTKPSAFVSTAANLGRVSPDWTDCDLVGASLILTRSSCGIIVWNRRQQVAQVVVVDVVVVGIGRGGAPARRRRLGTGPAGRLAAQGRARRRRGHALGPAPGLALGPALDRRRRRRKPRGPRPHHSAGSFERSMVVWDLVLLGVYLFVSLNGLL